MSRKLSLLWTLADAIDSGFNYNTKANPTNCQNLDNICIQVVCPPTASGTLNIYISNDKVDPKQGQSVVNWTPLQFDASNVISGMDGGEINLNQGGFTWLAFEWLASGGTGLLTAQLSAKMIG